MIVERRADAFAFLRLHRTAEERKAKNGHGDARSIPKRSGVPGHRPLFAGSSHGNTPLTPNAMIARALAKFSTLIARRSVTHLPSEAPSKARTSCTAKLPRKTQKDKSTAVRLSPPSDNCPANPRKIASVSGFAKVSSSVAQKPAPSRSARAVVASVALAKRSAFVPSQAPTAIRTSPLTK